MTDRAGAFSSFVARLAARLDQPLPGVDAQVEMAPVYRRNPGMARIDGKDCRDASVLALLHPVDRRPHVLFIERPGHLSQHAGQIAFPGGRREAGESLVETALRETREEIGIEARDIRILGPLTPLYVPPSRFCVHPFVGIVSGDIHPVPDPGEVADVFSLPLEQLLDDAARRDISRRVKDRSYVVPCFDVDDRQIWGATAMMLAELVAVARGAG